MTSVAQCELAIGLHIASGSVDHGVDGVLKSPFAGNRTRMLSHILNLWLNCFASLIFMAEYKNTGVRLRLCVCFSHTGSVCKLGLWG